MTQYVASISYGKDSLAMLEAIKQLGWPLDRIITADVWATDEIPADLPPMVEFKRKADEIIKEKYGIVVEHVCARPRERERERESTSSLTKSNSIPTLMKAEMLDVSMASHMLLERGAQVDSNPTSCNQCLEKLTYEKCFYRVPNRKKTSVRGYGADIWGFPMLKGQWCTSQLKTSALRVSNFNQTRKLVYQPQDQCF